MLQSIQLKNLLSFGSDSEPLPLQKLNVLIGPNGSGKSNLLEAIGLLQAAPRDVAAPIRNGGGIHEWLWHGATEPAPANIKVVVDGLSGRIPLRYDLEFAESDDRLKFSLEEIANTETTEKEKKPRTWYRFTGTVPRIRSTAKRTLLFMRKNFDRARSILAQRKDPDRYPELTYLGETFERIRIYREWSFGRRSVPRLPQKADMPTDFLMEDCSNLGLVLNRLRRAPAVKKQIVERLQLLHEGFDDFDVRVEGGTVQVFLQESPTKASDGGWIVPATRLSDGTLRYLCLLAILLDPNPPPLVCIEEPELGLHPDIVASLGELLVAASERMQLVVTTHSDVLVDALTEHPEAVIVCEKRQGATCMRRLDRESLAVWLEKYSLGQLWRDGEIGGNRW
jgi:predicted ATPase